MLHSRTRDSLVARCMLDGKQRKYSVVSKLVGKVNCFQKRGGEVWSQDDAFT